MADEEFNIWKRIRKFIYLSSTWCHREIHYNAKFYQKFIEFWKIIKYLYFLLYVHIIGSWLQSTNRVRIHGNEWMVNIHSIILYVPLRYRYIKCWRSDKSSWSWFLSEQKIMHTILKRNFQCSVHNERKYSFLVCIIYNFYIALTAK